MNDRLQKFLSAENLTQAQFADSINVARGGVSHIISGRNYPSYEFIINTMKRYPDLNIEWLLTGKGKMYKSLPSEKAVQFQKDENSDDTLDLFPADPVPHTDNDERAIPEPAVIRASDTVTTQDGFPDNAQCPAPSQVPVQRKATKVVIFYDDGTYQEF